MQLSYVCRFFFGFPYLYNGDAAYKVQYLQTYIDAPNSVIVLAFEHNDRVVGASTGVLLENKTEKVKQLFLEADVDIASIF